MVTKISNLFWWRAKIIFGRGRFLLFCLLIGFFLFDLPLVGAAGLVLPAQPGTFVVAPARKELSVVPGQTQTFYLRVANHLGYSANFSIDFADLNAQAYGREGYVVATSAARYSLTEIVSADQKDFLLTNDQELQIPIKISIPSDWPPISVAGLINLGPTRSTAGQANAQIKTSAGALLLVRVKGPSVENGQIEKFGLIGSNFVKVGQPIKLQVAYKNSGNVYLNPYGIITLKNSWGQKVSTHHLDPWFVLPSSIRLREINLVGHWWPGLYRAELDLNLGFGDQVVRQGFYFLIIPTYWQWLILIIVIIILLRIGLRKRRHEQN